MLLLNLLFCFLWCLIQLNQVDLLIQWRESDGINIIILIVILEFVIWAIFMFNFFFTSSLLFSSSSLLYLISPLKNLVDSSFSSSSSSSSFSFPLSCSKFCCMMMMMMQLILSYSDFFSSYWASLLSHQSHSHHLSTQYSYCWSFEQHLVTTTYCKWIH